MKSSIGQLVVFLFTLQSLFANQDSIPKVAVCIVGSNLMSVNQDIVESEKMAIHLEQNGYLVYRFFAPNDKWEDIKSVAREASLFIYRGHGTLMGIDGGFGGLVLDEFVSAARIANELKFKYPALVVFTSVCGGAGSSAEDESDIGVHEAYKRVKGSALPFLLAGAKGYYANNYFQGTSNSMNHILAGEDLETVFFKSMNARLVLERNEFLSDNRLSPQLKICISSNPGGGVASITTEINGKRTTKEITMPKEYPIAFVGDPRFVLRYK